jgi:hypothetical protein
LDRSQELLAFFEQAGNNSKVMCVLIDYAKKDQLVMFCNEYRCILVHSACSPSPSFCGAKSRQGLCRLNTHCIRLY